ncbi:hypothetical protein HID58_053745, partial [Brassica napus]
RLFLNTTSAIHFYFNNESGAGHVALAKARPPALQNMGVLRRLTELNDRHEISTAGHRSTRPTGLGPSTMLTGDCWANFNLLFKPISLQLHCKITEFHSCILDNKSTTNALPSIILRSSWSI